jgi:hypothetical protein
MSIAHANLIGEPIPLAADAWLSCNTPAPTFSISGLTTVPTTFFQDELFDHSMTSSGSS